MIKGFEHPHPSEPVQRNHWQAMPAVASGLIAGIILLVVPHASPWSGTTSFTPAIMGRVVPASWGLGSFMTVVFHLALAIVYGVLISLVVTRIRQLAAVVIGGLLGLVLYRLNLTVISVWFPAMRGAEVAVIVTHVVFGLIAAGAYRGLLRRKVPATTDQTPPPTV